MYNGADWAKRKDGQPFFAQIQLPRGKLRGGNVESTERFVNRIEKTFGNRTDVNKVSLPLTTQRPISFCRIGQLTWTPFVKLTGL